MLLTKTGPWLALLATAGLTFSAAVWLLVPPIRFRAERNPQTPPANLEAIDEIISRLDAVIAKPRQSVSGSQSSPGDFTANGVGLLDWARRVSLGLMGSIPSLEEIRQLEAQPTALREQWWVEHLLADRRTADHLAERFGRAFVGTENGPFIIYRRRRFVSWLSDQFFQNRPYDGIVRELLASEGIWTESPAVNFVTVTTDADGTGQPSPIRLAARTSRAFLAMRIDCLECHDDFLGNVRVAGESGERAGEQADFHRLAAFFAPAKNSLAGLRDLNSDPAYEFTLLDEREPTKFQPAVPLYPDLLSASGSSRERLANWVTHRENEQFARATVNRVWAIVFGRPLITPIDDIPLSEARPEALDLLAEDFIAHGYDLHRLLRILAQSTAMHSISKFADGRSAGPDWDWQYFPALRLRPEQVAHALVQSGSLTTLDSDAHVLRRLIGSTQESEFIDRYGDFGENEFEPRSETVTQRLLVLNGKLVREQLEQGYSSPVRLAALAGDPEKALEVLFLITLTRRPDAIEMARLLPQLKETWDGDRAGRLQDLYWVLLNSAEFASAR